MIKPSLCLLALLAGSPALAQIAPDGPPHTAAPADAVPPPAPVASEQQARQRLKESGYPEISDLEPAPEGGWTATARAGGRDQAVRVTPDGQVDRVN